MNKVTPVAFATLAALTASGCTQGAKASADTAQIEQSIKAQEAQWAKDYNAKDLNGNKLSGQSIYYFTTVKKALFVHENASGGSDLASQSETARHLRPS